MEGNEGRGKEEVRVRSLSPLSFPGLLHILTLPRHFIHNLHCVLWVGNRDLVSARKGCDLAKVIEPKSFVTRLKVLVSTFILFAQVGTAYHQLVFLFWADLIELSTATIMSCLALRSIIIILIGVAYRAWRCYQSFPIFTVQNARSSRPCLKSLRPLRTTALGLATHQEALKRAALRDDARTAVPTADAFAAHHEIRGPAAAHDRAAQSRVSITVQGTGLEARYIKLLYLYLSTHMKLQKLAIITHLSCCLAGCALS